MLADESLVLLIMQTVMSHAVFLPSAPFVPAALRCNCTTVQCEKTGFQCETDGACMASTSLIDGQEQHVRRCITRDNLVPPGQPFFCLGAEGLLNIHCCYTDYCNSIDLKVPSGKSSEVAHGLYIMITNALTLNLGYAEIWKRPINIRI